VYKSEDKKSGLSSVLCDDCQEKEDAPAILLLKNPESFYYKKSKIKTNNKGKPQPKLESEDKADNAICCTTHQISICESDN
jgi:hypothetical protein